MKKAINPEIQVIDLLFQESPQVIAAYLIPSDDGWILVESGPHSCWGTLSQTLESKSLRPEDIQHVLLTHIHLDHAGAAWAFAETGATIHVHPAGSPHLADPSKLLISAERIYGDRMQTLWGTIRPIALESIHSVEHEEILEIGNQQFKALHTPGHARHHIAWEWNDVLFTGDVAGVRIGEGIVAPPCPPPEFDPEAWKNSLSILRTSSASRLALTHFGLMDEKQTHLEQLETALERWVDFFRQLPEVKDRESITADFLKFIHRDFYPRQMTETLRLQYDQANPPWMSVEGILGYLAKRAKE